MQTCCQAQMYCGIALKVFLMTFILAWVFHHGTAAYVLMFSSRFFPRTSWICSVSNI
jgi:hypothetical protein